MKKEVRVIFLTGMMGSGKTTVGRELARRLGWRFIDLDAVITRSTRMSIRHIFETKGEPAFRAIESRALRSLNLKRPAVVATGGGAIIKAANRAFMRKTGLVVYLKVGLGTLKKRLTIGQSHPRPLLQAGAKTLQSLARQRKPLYEQAHLIISGSAAFKTVANSLLRACKHQAWLPAKKQIKNELKRL